MGVADTLWRTWRIFHEPPLEKLTFQETNRKYIGEVARPHNSQPPMMHGFGVFLFKKKHHRFEGEFSEDNFNGYGIYVWQYERQYYEGEWSDGRHHGLGMFVKDGGIRYEGTFVEGRFDGNGFGKYPNGDMYIGDWKDNAKHGEGMMYFEDGS